MAFRVVGAFVLIGVVGASIAWLDQPEEHRLVTGMVTDIRQVASQSWKTHYPVTIVRLDDGRVILCNSLLNFGRGSRVTVSVAKSRLFGREVVEC
jgi:hypothetical protein